MVNEQLNLNGLSTTPVRVASFTRKDNNLAILTDELSGLFTVKVPGIHFINFNTAVSHDHLDPSCEIYFRLYVNGVAQMFQSRISLVTESTTLHNTNFLGMVDLEVGDTLEIQTFTSNPIPSNIHLFDAQFTIFSI